MNEPLVAKNSHDDLFGEFDRITRLLSPKRPRTLYHYTTPIGLLGILESRSLWATHISYLNDSEEMEYAKKLILTSIETANKNRLYTQLDAYLTSVRNVFTYFDDYFDYYIACFCEEGDLLSQWRAYSDSGVGYSIGFDVKRFQNNDNTSENQIMLRKVVYDSKKQIPIIESIIRNGFEIYKKNIDMDKEDLLPYVVQVVIYLIECSFSFKHPSFAEEKEWRVVVRTKPNDTSDILFRPTRKGLIPYLQLGFEQITNKTDKNFPVSEIIHGPSLHPRTTKECLKKILIKWGFNNTIIDGSDVPLRM